MKVIYPIIFFLLLVISPMSKSEVDKSLSGIESQIKRQVPGYEFMKIVRPVIFREGVKYLGEPYIIENIYQTSSRVCRVRRIPLVYMVDEDLWVLDENRMHRDLIYTAAVIDKSEKNSCDNLDYDKDFFITAAPISDDSLVKLYESFLDKRIIRSESSSLLHGKWDKTRLNELLSTIDKGKILSVGISSFGFFQKSIDYEVILGLAGSPITFVFHVYYDNGMKFRKIEEMHSD